MLIGKNVVCYLLAFISDAVAQLDNQSHGAKNKPEPQLNYLKWFVTYLSFSEFSVLQIYPNPDSLYSISQIVFHNFYKFK